MDWHPMLSISMPIVVVQPTHPTIQPVGDTLSSVTAKLLAIVFLLSLPHPAPGQTDAVQRARTALAAQRYDDAMSIYESVLGADPTSQAAKSGEIEAASSAALAFRNKGQLEEALSYLLRARKVVVADPRLFFDLGILENQMRLNHDADEALHQSLSLRPDDPLTMYAIARVKMDLGLYPDAEEAMRAYLRKRPDDASAHYGLGRILVINLKDDAALDEFQRSIALKPTQTESYYEIGEIALRANDLDTAEKNYQICLKRDPQHGGALTGMGIVKYRTKQYQQAADYLERAVSFAPEFQTAHYYDGLTLSKLGRKEEAEAQLATASKMAAENSARKGDGLRLAPQ